MQMTHVTAGPHWNLMTFTLPQQGGYWVLYEPAVPGSITPLAWTRSYRRAATLRGQQLTVTNPLVFSVRPDIATGLPDVYLVTD